MPRLPTVTPRQVIRALEKVGSEIDRQTGSHVVRWRASDGLRVVYPAQPRFGSGTDFAYHQNRRINTR